LSKAMTGTEDRDIDFVLGQLVGEKTDGGRRAIKRDTAKERETLSK
jgi:hypothetical protein